MDTKVYSFDICLQYMVVYHKQLKSPIPAEPRHEGYRRLTFMLLDQDIVAVSPSSTWPVLGQAGLLHKWNRKKSLKGTGFVQPLSAHDHWHVDISYINICGTFYYLCTSSMDAVVSLFIGRSGNR